MHAEEDEEGAEEFTSDFVVKPRQSRNVTSGAATMLSTWTRDGEPFCRKYKLQQSFQCVLDTDAYDDDTASVLHDAWCRRMNFWFYKDESRSLTVAEVARAHENYTDPAPFRDLAATATDEVLDRMQQIRAVRPVVPRSNQLSVAPRPAAASASSSSSSSSSAGGL
jgi:hypothetical protein